MGKQRGDVGLGVAVQRGARLVALEAMDALGDAHERFVAGEPDALHDVRVAVRRLRTWLRAYRPVLDDTVGKKSQRVLKKLADDTAIAREAEVALGMLNELPPPPPRTRSGHTDLQRRLEREAARSRGETEAALAKSIPRVVERLTRELAHYRLDFPVDGEPQDETMAEFTADVVERHGEKLAGALEALDERASGDDASPDPDALHVARIWAKRLRYVVERLPTSGTGAGALAERLTSLQDTLGEYRDARLLAERALAEIGRSARVDARERSRALLAGGGDKPVDTHSARQRVRPGLLQVARGADARAKDAWRRFEEEWPRGKGAERLRGEVRVAIDGLSVSR
jgi:CHAD domain-containing protein